MAQNIEQNKYAKFVPHIIGSAQDPQTLQLLSAGTLKAKYI